MKYIFKINIYISVNVTILQNNMLYQSKIVKKIRILTNLFRVGQLWLCVGGRTIVGICHRQNRSRDANIRLFIDNCTGAFLLHINCCCYTVHEVVLVVDIESTQRNFERFATGDLKIYPILKELIYV